MATASDSLTKDMTLSPFGKSTNSLAVRRIDRCRSQTGGQTIFPDPQIYAGAPPYRPSPPFQASRAKLRKNVYSLFHKFTMYFVSMCWKRWQGSTDIYAWL
ncbi:hypothetical protein CDAR_570121 [Caerostris darwini]|uniref:Uncharacterized protein n=1 Tax=Caerostris darwini TaxID=1538125 RepID=A0AAV4RVP2_9ARAC|nr:hypothetical protein CDAR_570121 [Caerostris darwini]